MSSPVPDRPELRISDADRERAIQRLNDAVAEGRLTMTEFEERVAAVLAARTASQLAPHLADLPGRDGAPAAPEYAELRSTMSSLKRTGQWRVPRRLAVQSRAGSVLLDFSQATISHPVVEVALEVYAGSTTLILPAGATVDVEQVETDMIASTVKVKKVPSGAEQAGTPHIVVSGRQWVGTLTVRYQRKFLGKRW